MSAKKRTFDVGARVFAKVRGYPAWPARVESVQGGGKYGVFFYGTYESAVVKAPEMWPFDETSKNKFGKQKRKGFAEALYEIQNNPEIRTAEQLMEMELGKLGENEQEPPQEPPPPAQEEQQQKQAPEGAAAKDNADGAGLASPATEAPEEKAPVPEEKPETPTTTPAPAPAPAPAQPKTLRGRKKSGSATPASVTPKTGSIRGPKRKAATDDANSTPESRPSAAKVPRSNGESGSETPMAPPLPIDQVERTSRSGRVIKPKKFVDEDVGNTPKQDESASPALPPTRSSATKASKEERKMWVQVKATGDVVEINLDEGRPVKFDSKDSEIQWERATAKNALKFKEKVESGEFIPDEVRRKIEEKTQRTPEEEEILRKEKESAARKEKIHWLKMEQHIIDLDLAIKQALHFEHPDMPRCINALEELSSLALHPLMLKKQPQIVTTVRKLRKYVGPQAAPEPKMKDEWIQEAQKIRLKANQMYMKLQNAFVVPEGGNFWEVFEAKLVEFRDATKDMDEKKLLTLVTDPTRPAQES